jgi:hypothetical protein
MLLICNAEHCGKAWKKKEASSSGTEMGSVATWQLTCSLVPTLNHSVT